MNNVLYKGIMPIMLCHYSINSWSTSRVFRIYFHLIFLFQLYFWSIQFYLCPLTMLALGLYTFLVCVYGIIISNQESRGLVSLVAVFLSIAFLGQIFSIYSAFDLRNIITEPISNVDYKSVNMSKIALHRTKSTINVSCCKNLQFLWNFYVK